MHRAVEGLGRGVAEVAFAAGDLRLAKIAKQRVAAAFECFGQTQKGVQPGVVCAFTLRIRKPFVDLLAAKADVVGAVKRQRVGRRAIAARAADFLVIAFDGFGQVGMGDPAHVGFVDAHAEGDCGHDNQAVFARETRLYLAAQIGVHAAVVVAGGPSKRRVTISARVSSSAVAVKADRGTSSDLRNWPMRR